MRTAASANNTRVDDTAIPVTLLPRPDLQVTKIVSPPQADPNQTIAVEFAVTNLGNAGTTVPHWTDRVWLSLDPRSL